MFTLPWVVTLGLLLLFTIVSPVGAIVINPEDIWISEDIVQLNATVSMGMLAVQVTERNPLDDSSFHFIELLLDTDQIHNTENARVGGVGRTDYRIGCLTGILNACDLLPSEYQKKLHQYASATVRYFTSPEANNTLVGFTHTFFGTGPWQEYVAGLWQEGPWPLTRGYGSHVNINEVTLGFLSLSAAYKMNWLDYLPESERYDKSWGQILKGLQTLYTMQTSGNKLQFVNGHFHRFYLTTISRNGVYDIDRTAQEIERPASENTQSSDDNALAFMNLLLLEGLASDPSLDIRDRVEITNRCKQIRAGLNCLILLSTIKSCIISMTVFPLQTRGSVYRQRGL